MAKLINFVSAPWQHWSKLKPDHLALITEQDQFTWRELCEQINAFTGHFLKIEMPVALLAKTEEHCAILFSMLAAWQQGVATLLINSAFSQGDIHAILKNTGIQTLIQPQSLSNKSAKNVETSFDFNKPLTLTLTSGSTGLPKAVVHNARQHLFSAVGLSQVMPFQEQDCWLLSLPLYHISGLAIIWRWLAVGAKLKISNCRGAHLLKSLEDISHASFVPTQLQRVVDCQLDSKSDTNHHLRFVLLGGATIPKFLVDRAQKQGIACWCGYGMTEMASTISAKRADHIDSVGKALPFRKIMLSAENEILVQGQTLALGYFRQAKLKPIKSDWFATKDVGQWLEKGELSVNGRLDNMFISGGENIQPESIEKKLSQFPNIGQIMILPWADQKWGRVPIAFVEKDVDHQAFFAFAKANLLNYQIPQKIFRIPTDLLHSGIKLSRAKLAHRLKKMQPDEE